MERCWCSFERHTASSCDTGELVIKYKPGILNSRKEKIPQDPDEGSKYASAVYARSVPGQWLHSRRIAVWERPRVFQRQLSRFALFYFFLACDSMGRKGLKHPQSIWASQITGATLLGYQAKMAAEPQQGRCRKPMSHLQQLCSHNGLYGSFSGSIFRIGHKHNRTHGCRRYLYIHTQTR